MGVARYLLSLTVSSLPPLSLLWVHGVLNRKETVAGCMASEAVPKFQRKQQNTGDISEGAAIQKWKTLKVSACPCVSSGGGGQHFFSVADQHHKGERTFLQASRDIFWAFSSGSAQLTKLLVTKVSLVQFSSICCSF